MVRHVACHHPGQKTTAIKKTKPLAVKDKVRRFKELNWTRVTKCLNKKEQKKSQREGDKNDDGDNDGGVGPFRLPNWALEKLIMLSVPDQGDDKIGYANALNVEVVAGTGRRVITGGVDLN